MVKRLAVEFDEFGKLGRIRAVLASNLACRHHVRLHADHRVQLDPLDFRLRTAVLFIEPSLISGPGKSGRVHGESRFDGPERGRASGDEVVKDRRRFIAVEEVQHAVEVRDSRNEPAVLSFVQVAHEPTGRHGAVRLVDGTERGIGGTDRLLTATGRGRGKRGADVREERPEVAMLVDLRPVVIRPVLRVGLPLDRFNGHRRDGLSTIWMALGLRYGEFHGEKMLALRAPLGKIGA